MSKGHPIGAILLLGAVVVAIGTGVGAVGTVVIVVVVALSFVQFTGATGLMQAHELVTQLRGEAAKRQVDGASVGLQHNFGLGGVAVVTVYGKPQQRSNL